MAQGLNSVTLLGNLGADPELKVSQGGMAVLNLRLATSKSWFDKEKNERQEQTEWHRVVVFQKRAEGLAKILKKGDRICVLGEIKTSSYEKDGVKTYSTSIVANDVILAGGGNKKSDADESGTPDDNSENPWEGGPSV